MNSPGGSLTISSLIPKFSVARVIALFFLFFIFFGSACIFISEKFTLSYVDSLYLSASAICVTGLSPIPLSSLSHSTHWIIMILVQIGGLGIITFTVLIGLLIIKGESRNLSFNSIVSDAIDSTEEANITKKYKSREVRRILFSIINISLTLELMGAISIYFLFPDDLPQGVDRLFFSIFTSVSSFNNAGFSIIDDLSIILHEPLSIYLVSSLIILGGLGFPVIIYLEKWFLQTIQKFFYHLESKFETIFYHQLISNSNISKNTFFYEQLIKLSHIMDEKINSYNSQLHGESNRIQNKILFIGTILLLSIGTGLILIFEWNNYNTIYDMSFADKLANSFFISVCSRTAGFATMDLVGLYDSSIVLIILLMIIGGGSQGTAGGIKITTFAILFVYLKNVINPGKPVKIFGEIVSKNSVAISIRVYFLATVTMVLLMLLLSILDDSQFNLHANAFELVSAFSTVGFSLGITPDLKEIEKLLYVFIMFIGRIGIFTVLIAITGSSGTPKIENDDGVKIQVG